jgi:uncharacterized protein (TIGR03435 family)
MRPALGALAVLLFAAAPLEGQAPDPDASQDARTEAFDVVSIRRNESGSRAMQRGMLQRGGRYTMVNTPLSFVVGPAHPTESGEVLGLPDWVRGERYDIEARVGHDGPIYPEDLQRMLRAMLADRLGLRVHVETREREIYELVRADPDGPVPPAVRRSDIDCEQYRRSRVVRFQGPEPPEPELTADGVLVCASMPFGEVFRSGGLSMEDFAAFLRGRLGRIVRDRTGLEGYYEFELRHDDRPLSVSLDAEPSNFPDLFTALRAQLGLTLESRTAPVEVLVVDHIERPSPN